MAHRHHSGRRVDIAPVPLPSEWSYRPSDDIKRLAAPNERPPLPSGCHRSLAGPARTGRGLPAHSRPHQSPRPCTPARRGHGRPSALRGPPGGSPLLTPGRLAAVPSSHRAGWRQFPPRTGPAGGSPLLTPDRLALGDATSRPHRTRVTRGGRAPSPR